MELLTDSFCATTFSDTLPLQPSRSHAMGLAGSSMEKRERVLLDRGPTLPDCDIAMVCSADMAQVQCSAVDVGLPRFGAQP